jgi:hypothetical protein
MGDEVVITTWSGFHHDSWFPIVEVGLPDIAEIKTTQPTGRIDQRLLAGKYAMSVHDVGTPEANPPDAVFESTGSRNSVLQNSQTFGASALINLCR